MINEWVASKTASLIPQIVSPQSFDENTRLALINAVYLKAKWVSPFKTADTGSEQFFPDPEHPSKTVSMMHQTDEMLYTDLDVCQVLKLHYLGGVSISIFLPHPGRSTAAAVTVVLVGKAFGKAEEAVEQEVVIFKADHPFLFVIRHDRTGAILFIGRVHDPASSI